MSESKGSESKFVLKNFKFIKLKSKIIAIGLATLSVIAIAVLILYVNNKKVDSPVVVEKVEEVKIDASVSYFDGKVSYIDTEGQMSKVSLDQKVTEGSYIKTGDNSKVEIKLEDGSYIRLNSNSIVAILKLSQDKVLLRNSKGEIYSRVSESTNRAFIVNVEDFSYTAQGTAFLSLNSETNKGVKVFQSKVRVSSTVDKIETIIEEGKKYFVSKKEVTELIYDDVNNDFALWNKLRDSEMYKDFLGALNKEYVKTDEKSESAASETTTQQAAAPTPSPVPAPAPAPAPPPVPTGPAPLYSNYFQSAYTEYGNWKAANPGNGCAATMLEVSSSVNTDFTLWLCSSSTYPMLAIQRNLETNEEIPVNVYINSTEMADFKNYGSRTQNANGYVYGVQKLMDDMIAIGLP